MWDWRWTLWVVWTDVRHVRKGSPNFSSESTLCCFWNRWHLKLTPAGFLGLIHVLSMRSTLQIHVESMLNPFLITVFWSFPDRLPFLKLSDQRPEDVATLSQALAERDQDAWRFFSKWISANELKTGLWNLRLFFPQNCRGILPTHHLLKSYECRIKMIYLCNLQNMIEPL